MNVHRIESNVGATPVNAYLVDTGEGIVAVDGTLTASWVLEGEDAAFIGDQIYNRMHAYLADGHWERWLEHLDRLPAGATLYPGHGRPTTAEMASWQRGYITTFVEAVRAADVSDPERAKADVVARMTAYLPGGELRFLMELSIEPMAAAMT